MKEYHIAVTKDTVSEVCELLERLGYHRFLVAPSHEVKSVLTYDNGDFDAYGSGFDKLRLGGSVELTPTELRELVAKHEQANK